MTDNIEKADSVELVVDGEEFDGNVESFELTDERDTDVRDHHAVGQHEVDFSLTIDISESETAFLLGRLTAANVDDGENDDGGSVV